MDPKEMALMVADYLDSKKGENILVLDVAHLTSIADYFVIASARNSIQARTMAEDLEDHMAEKGILPSRKEGAKETRWIVVDYGTVLVHIFHEQEREYYNLERLWADGTNLVKSLGGSN